MYYRYLSEERYRSGQNGIRPLGCWRKCRYAALLVAHLELANYTPCALPDSIWAIKAATW